MTGFWKRDHDFFNQYHQQSRNRDGFLEWLEEWVHKPLDHEQYLEKLGATQQQLKIQGKALSRPVNYASE